MNFQKIAIRQTEFYARVIGGTSSEGDSSDPAAIVERRVK